MLTSDTPKCFALESVRSGEVAIEIKVKRAKTLHPKHFFEMSWPFDVRHLTLFSGVSKAMFHLRFLDRKKKNLRFV